MANIKISDLRPAGLNLFSDSEGYLNDLSEQEQSIQGGIFFSPIIATIGAFGVGVTIGRLL